MRLYSEKDVIEGVFKAELKNRFLCTVCINGEEVVCYIPSSCKMDRFIDLNNKAVLLRENISPKARTQYAVIAVKQGCRQIMLNLSQANQVVEEQLHRRFFSFLGKRKHVLHEVDIDGYRSDLYIQDTNTVIEVKTLLAFERKAYFPSVYSERAIDQLKKLSRLLDEGYKVCYLIVSLSHKVKEVEIDMRFNSFGDALRECMNKGMLLKAVSIQNTDGDVEICSSVKVLF